MAAFEAFAEVLNEFKAASSLDELLDEQSGLALKWGNILGDMVEEAASFSSTAPPLSPAQIEAMNLERSTWSLIHSLYAERLTPPDVTASPQSLLSQNPYTPPLSLIQSIISNSPSLSELMIIRESLQNSPSSSSSKSVGLTERKQGYAVETLELVKQGKRTGGKGVSAGLVKSLDPDASVRARGVRGGGSLGPEDSNHLLALLPTLYTHLRHGRLPLLSAQCRANDQSWRAAALEASVGGWWMGGLSSKDEDEMVSDDEEEEMEGGEKRRTLWKKVGRSLAANNALPLYERAIYGVLTGYLPAVLPVCRDWEDQVWARIGCLIEERIDVELRKAGGFWYEEFSRASDDRISSDRVDDLEDESVREIFKAILAWEGEGIAMQARHPYRTTQMRVALKESDVLIESFAASLDGLKESTSPDLYPSLLRFFTHLIIYLRLLNLAPPALPSQQIIITYVEILKSSNEEHKGILIPIYCAALGDVEGEEAYARYLAGVFEGKKDALERGRGNGLDGRRVARLVVSIVLDEVFSSIPGLDAEEPDVTDFNIDVQEGGPDHTLIRSLEWLTATSDTFSDALIQANALVRYFLSAGKVHAAKDLLLRLPADFLKRALIAAKAEGIEATYETHASEHLHHTMLFQILELYNKCSEVWSEKPSEHTLKIDQLDWLKNFTNVVAKTRSLTIELLTTDWLKYDLEIDMESLEDERRQAELSRIRHIFVPELVFRLHSLLFETRDIIAGNLQLALDLPTIVADERYSIYQDFVQARIQRLTSYLELVRVTSLETLKDGNMDPFTVAT